MADKIFEYIVWSIDKTELDSDILTVKVKGGTQSLTGTNNRSIKDSKILAGEMDLDVGKKLDIFELMLLMVDLAAKHFGLLCMLLLNNSLGITPLLIDDLANANW